MRSHVFVPLLSSFLAILTTTTAIAQEPATVAEASGFTRTGTSDRVDAFLDEIAAASENVTLTVIGRTHDGRDLTMAVLADPPVADAEAARRSGKPSVLLFGNIHAGEVCGKEALQMLLRDIAQDTEGGELRSLLDELIILVLPNYNADANDGIAPGNRPGQDGPEAMGERANSQGYDLNRDWTKLDAPETRAFVRMLHEWDPAVIVDTHTTNGSLHRFTLTYQGPKHPGTDPEPLGYVRDTMLPAVDAAFERETGYLAFWYGNLDLREHDRGIVRWRTYPGDPRYGAAYRGLRNRISILSEAYAYASFEDRVRATYAFCREILGFTAENADAITALLEAADERTTAAGRDPSDEDRVPLRVRARAFDDRVEVAGYEPVAGEEELRPNERSRETPAEFQAELVNDFVATESVRLPYAYLMPASLEHVAHDLQRHGIEVEVLREDLDLDVETYVVAGIRRAEGEYEGHTRIEDLRVDTIPGTIRARHGLFVVRTGQPLGTLAAYLLEPRATDGLAAWNALDDTLEEGEDYPVVRVPDRSPMLLRSARPLPEDRSTGRRLTYEDVYGEDRLDRDGSPARFTWDGPEHALVTRDGELRRVRLATGRSEPLDRDTDEIAERLATLPTITQEDAERYARRFLNPDPELPGLVFEHADDLYFAEWDGSNPARLTSTPETEELAEISPDGAFVAFVREHDLHVIDLATRTERALTTGGTDLVRNGKAAWVYYEEIFGRSWKAFWWSPDSRHLALFITDSTGMPEFLLVDDTEEPQRVERTRYPKPGMRNPRVRVGIVSVAGGPVRTVDLSDYDGGASIVGMIAWAAREEPALRLGLMDRAQTWMDVLEVGTRGGEPRRLFRETTGAWVDPPADTRPGRRTWSSGAYDLEDGGFLWLSERDGWKHIYRYSDAGEPLGRVTAGEYEVDTVHLVDELDGRVYFSASSGDATGSHLYRVALEADGESPAEPERLTPEEGTHDISLSPGGDILIDTHSAIGRTPRVVLRSLSGAEIRVLDDNPVYELEEFDLPRIERVSIASDKGVSLEGMLFYPTDFDPDRAYPVWFMTYAGPHAPTVRDSFRGGWLAERLVAEEGIVVFRADPYPASGKGAVSAWTNYQRLGEREMEDIEELIAWVTDHRWADASRVGMSGHSYGGFMTSYAMTHSELFSAGIAGAPVTDWRDYDTIYTERYMRTPQDNPDGYDGTSVVARAKHLHGRLLLLHGTMDDNVHMQNSIRLIDALRRANKQFDMFIYPGFRHGLRNSHYARLTHDFILKTMLTTPDAETPPPSEGTPDRPETEQAGQLGPAPDR